MTAKIQVRRDTTANWNAGTPPTLDVGEIGLDTDLKQIKIGDNVNNWTALPWLGGTLPYFSSPNADIDAVSNRETGLYRWAGIASITSGTVPAAPIDIKTADGGINMLVLKFGTTVMQHLWTDGDGTVTPKSYTRVWDGDVSAWRAWVPQNIWGISATEGVDVVAKSITLKDTATGLVVDGNSTLTGTASFGGVASFTAGTAGSPAVTTTGDTDTGVFFPSANKVAFAAGGVQQLVVDSAQADILAAIFRAGATFNERIDMNGFRITDMGAPSALADAMNLSSFLDRISIIAPSSSDGNNYTASNGTTWTLDLTQARWLTAAGGNYDGVVMAFDGNGFILPAFCRTFHNDPSPINANVGSLSGGQMALIAIKRS